VQPVANVASNAPATNRPAYDFFMRTSPMCSIAIAGKQKSNSEE
jgi:hypothetical protein